MAAMMRKYIRRRYTWERLVTVVAILTLGLLAVIFFVGPPQETSFFHPQSQITNGYHNRHILSVQDNNSMVTEGTPTTAAPNSRTLYPPEVFTMDQLKKGAVILYILGMMYMFVALAIVCDEFFVPSLEVIIQVSGISEDVAGATFMAAGGSAPELFTSIIGVFIAHSDVGIGTIVGSAVFNILFVIGMCAMCSLTVLTLTWWPLFRDVTFYSVSLIMLICFFYDFNVYWYEALGLLLWYAAYVIFMKFNCKIERFVKSMFGKNRVNSAVARSTDNLIDIESPNKPGHPSPAHALKSGSSKFRHGVLQLMIHTIDPLGEAKVHDKALKLHAIASIKSINGENHNNPQECNQNGNGTARNGSITAISNGVLMQNGDDKITHRKTDSQVTALTGVDSVTDYQAVSELPQPIMGNNNTNSGAMANQPSDPMSRSSSQGNLSDSKSQIGDLGEENEPLDLSWPETNRKRLTYILVAPLIFPLWLTLADVRRGDRRNFFPWTFIGSILWIGVFSYLMNWWASTTGKVIGIPDAVMGLTFLAAGTSIPDLITSVIVAKKGFGDMAVSSSVGSNIFDVTVGLPFPWLIYGAINSRPYHVDSKGLFCSIILLFGMLLFVIISIAAFKWKMNKALGCTMFVLYGVFLTIALLLEYDKIKCNVF